MTNLLCTLSSIYLIAIFGRIILSWFPMAPGSPMTTVSDILVTVTEPVLGPLRRVIPSVGVGGMGLDLSPLVATLLIQIVVRGILLDC